MLVEEVAISKVTNFKNSDPQWLMRTRDRNQILMPPWRWY